MGKQKKNGGRKQKQAVNYSQTLIDEEYDRLKENARSRRINKALEGRRCPPEEGVIRLIKQKGMKL